MARISPAVFAYFTALGFFVTPQQATASLSEPSRVERKPAHDAHRQAPALEATPHRNGTKTTDRVPGVKRPATSLRWSASLGSLLGVQFHTTRCEATGGMECAVPEERSVYRKLELAPFVESRLALTVGPFRYSPGVRFVPRGVLDSGSELHVLLGPAWSWSWSARRVFTIGFDGAFDVVFPSRDTRSVYQDARVACERSVGYERCTYAEVPTALGGELYARVTVPYAANLMFLQVGWGTNAVLGGGGQADYSAGTSGADEGQLHTASFLQSHRLSAQMGLEWD